MTQAALAEEMRKSRRSVQMIKKEQNEKVVYVFGDFYVYGNAYSLGEGDKIWFSFLICFQALTCDDNKKVNCQLGRISFCAFDNKLKGLTMTVMDLLIL